jgi:tetratricopeptide (TPR) repeat protein
MTGTAKVLGVDALNQGKDLYACGLQEDAIRAYDNDFALEKNLADVLKGFGVTFNVDGLEKAIEGFTAALKVKPDYVKALYNRGIAYKNKGEPDKAIADFTAALGIKPDMASALYARGNTYVVKGDYEKAIKDYEAALKLKPDLHEALYNRGFAYDSKGDLDKAIADYAAALEIKPDKFEALYNRGNTYYYKGDLNKAIKDWEAALLLDPNDTWLKSNLEMARRERLAVRNGQNANSKT